jgi:hypothetical protein
MAVPDPLLPTDPPEPLALPQPSNRRPKIICECCGCELTPAGDAIKISDQYRGFRSQAEKIAALKVELEKAQADCATVTRERDDARAQIPKKSSLW